MVGLESDPAAGDAFPEKDLYYRMPPVEKQGQTAPQVANFQLPPGAILAPMAGITDSPFRRLARRYGAGLLYTECISAEGVRRGSAASLALCRFHQDERPIAVQLFGSEPGPIAEAAAVVAKHFAPDLIDINCGCPVKKFVTRGCGGALMQSPTKIGRIVAEVRAASGIAVSVKLRAGYLPGAESAPEAAQAAEEAGAVFIAVHGRFVRKAKGTPADWNVIARVKVAVAIPVVGNGDVESYADARRMIKETNCDRVMIARWAQGRPWIFEALNDVAAPPKVPLDPPPWERLILLNEHYRMMFDEFPEGLALLRMRKQAGWYLHGLADAAKVRQSIMHIDNRPALETALSEYLTYLHKPSPLEAETL